MNNDIDLEKWKVVWVDLPNEIYQETLSAIIIDENFYQIMDIPEIAENLNYLDIVSCINDDGKLVFNQVIKHSGNKTLHILFPEYSEYSEKEYRQQILDELVSIGATYKYNLSRACALNIPPEINLEEIVTLLKDWVKENKLEEWNIYGY